MRVNKGSDSPGPFWGLKLPPRKTSHGPKWLIHVHQDTSGQVTRTSDKNRSIHCSPVQRTDISTVNTRPQLRFRRL